MFCFKKKIPREWTFGDKPSVIWAATNNVKLDMLTATKIILSEW